MQKKRVSVQIEGRSYSLLTSDDERYVQSVAQEVVRSIRKTADGCKQLDTRDCAVLAALNFCDDRNKAVKRNKDIVDKADQIIHQTTDLNRLCAEYKEKLAEAINENTRLVKKVKALEEQLVTLADENKALKSTAAQGEEAPVQKTEGEKKNEKLMGYVPMRQVSLFDETPSNKDGKKN